MCVITLIFLVSGLFFAEGYASITFSGDGSAKNAKIFINDDEAGFIPKKIQTLIPGIYRIRLEKDHYKAQDFFIELREDENIDLNIEMSRENTENTVDSPENESEK